MNSETFATLCRICAADTRSRNSSPECVSIMKTPMLQDKIEKYLHLKVSEGDALPKVICKSCYRSVEGIVSLSKIAIHTQMVLSNFLKPHAALIEPDAEYTSFAISCKDFERNTGGTTAPASTPITHGPPPPPPLQAKPKRTEEVIVNVSVSDPLTRETQQKIIGATRQRQAMMDTRFVPKSIAHRHVSFATSTPKEIGSPAEPTNLCVNKKSTPTGVINYFNPQQQQQQVTVTSGGYVIGQLDTSPKQTISTAAAAVPPQQTTPPSVLNAPIANKNRSSSDNEQKRNNLKMTLKNIRASHLVNSGQVSLLKVSQKQNSQSQQQSTTKPPPSNRTTQLLTTQRSDVPEEALPRARALSPTIGRKSRKPPPQRRPTIAEIPSSVEALPKEIIIASVKKPKHSHTGERHGRSSFDDAEADLQKSLFPDDISLGRVIKDFDLLKLILKALKWPVNKDNMDMQMARLRSSKFTTIMSDPNLLQDTDLTQLLGPYLAPVLLAAQVLHQQQHHQQQQQQQQQQLNTVLSGDIPTDLSSTTTTNLASAIPYRLPPETSVQLVPASPEEERPIKSPTQASRKSTPSNKKSRRPAESIMQRDTSIVISDGEEEPASTSGGTRRKTDDKHKSKRIFEGDSMRFDPNGSSHLNFDSSFDMGKQLDERNRGGFDRVNALPSQRKHSNVGKTSGAASSIYPNFVDDIVLLESEQSKETNMPSPTKEAPRKKYTGALLSGINLTSASNPFTPRVVPPITRPIIKRRKTVIHASPSKTLMHITGNQQQADQMTDSSSDKEQPPTEVASNQTLTEQTTKATTVEANTSLPKTVDEINATNSSATTTTTISTASKSILKPVAPLSPSSTTLINQPSISETNEPTTSTSNQSTTSATSIITTISAMAPKKAVPITTAMIKVASTLERSKTPTPPPAPPSTSATTIDINEFKQTTTNLNKKVSVSTSMSFFNAVITQQTNTITPTPKEIPPKKSTKAALAEQLLEAVGLKKSNSSSSEKSANNETSANSRESVQQIRSALKRSLKQAVEQNLRKLEEQPIIKQIADSTTKGINKNLSVDNKNKQQPGSILKPITSIEIKENVDEVISVDEKSERPISLLKSRSAPNSEYEKVNIQITQEETKQRSTGRQPRKTATQTSVIKKSISTALKQNDEMKSISEPKSVEDQINFSPSLNDIFNTGNTVSSTSESLQSGDTVQFIRKRGRKRKIEEETGGDSVENIELDTKKDGKEEFETESVGMGDMEITKETSPAEESDKKADASGSTSRPSRVSKTMSKYYKGPDRQASTRSTRSTRNK